MRWIFSGKKRAKISREWTEIGAWVELFTEHSTDISKNVFTRISTDVITEATSKVLSKFP